ncbi:uncharacterized protein ASCRUDRAFT_73304 [Ascoidea rubescens DSM 1968]|uniref:BHLH domain-containing protein n=1 Tax=Ascoidea rubescens DSM 1968 TaxID=1344418 RepID=A0A1D2VPB1_9ASCO|nr:hypothetical protein ASCRUDRAFT_73304 [Ascoidea rubescens DSM 1968]ODV63448.1 hypothetical protein ASCRUDRAFT_73304 [Ascoidea rubescens DSM 1968]
MPSLPSNERYFSNTSSSKQKPFQLPSLANLGHISNEDRLPRIQELSMTDSSKSQAPQLQSHPLAYPQLYPQQQLPQPQNQQQFSQSFQSQSFQSQSSQPPLQYQFNYNNNLSQPQMLPTNNIPLSNYAPITPIAPSSPSVSKSASSSSISKNPNDKIPSKKHLHIRSEQRRREKISDGFAQLKLTVPTVRPGYDSKAAVLKKTAEYIEVLEYENKVLKHELALVSSYPAPHPSHTMPYSSAPSQNPFPPQNVQLPPGAPQLLQPQHTSTQSQSHSSNFSHQNSISSSSATSPSASAPPASLTSMLNSNHSSINIDRSSQSSAQSHSQNGFQRLSSSTQNTGTKKLPPLAPAQFGFLPGTSPNSNRLPSPSFMFNQSTTGNANRIPNINSNPTISNSYFSTSSLHQ